MALGLQQARQFLEDANARPAEVRDALIEVWAVRQVSSEEEAVLARAMGLALRNLRDLDGSERSLTLALDWFEPGTADHSGTALTLAGVLAHRSEFAQAFELLDTLTGPEELAARIVFQRAALFEFRGSEGDLGRAHKRYLEALNLFERGNDQHGRAHALSGLGLVAVHTGSPRDGMTYFDTARRIYESLSEPVFAAVMDRNVAWAAIYAADLGLAFEHLDRSERALIDLGEPFREVRNVRIQALIVAGLLDDALREGLDLVMSLRDSGSQTDESLITFMLGSALGAAGRSGDARHVLEVALARFDESASTVHRATARLQLALLDGTPPVDLASELPWFIENGPAHAPSVRLALARAAFEREDKETLELVRTSHPERTSNDIAEAEIQSRDLFLRGHMGTVVDIVASQLAGDLNQVLDLEVQAGISGTRTALVDLGLAAAVRGHDAVGFDRIVRVAKRAAHATNGDQAENHEHFDLTHGSRMTDAQDDLMASQTLTIAEVDHQVIASLTQAGPPEFIDDLPSSQSMRDLVRRHDVALATIAMGETRHLETVHKTAGIAAEWLPVLCSGGSTLQVTGHGWLESVPWNSLAERPVELVLDPAPGLARTAPQEPVVAVAVGPDLASSNSEIDAIRDAYPTGEVFVFTPTSAELFSIAERCDVLHLICHGDYDQQHPLRSSLRFNDGDVTGYQIQRLTTAPAIVVAAACRAGAAGTMIGAGSLGLSAAWLRAGSHAVVAPSCRLPDNERTATTMAAIHRSLAAGAAPSEAVFDARRSSDEAIARSLVVTTRGRLIREHANV